MRYEKPKPNKKTNKRTKLKQQKKQTASLTTINLPLNGVGRSMQPFKLVVICSNCWVKSNKWSEISAEFSKSGISSKSSRGATSQLLFTDIRETTLCMSSSLPAKQYINLNVNLNRRSLYKILTLPFPHAGTHNWWLIPDRLLLLYVTPVLNSTWNFAGSIQYWHICAY